MSLEEARKLKRGLRDISPLFDPDSTAPMDPDRARLKFLNTSSKPLLEVISVFSPDSPGDSLFLNTFLSSQIASEEKPCSILSIKINSEKQIQKEDPIQSESFGPHIRHLCLPWEKLEEIDPRQERQAFSNAPLSQLLFLDFESFYHPGMERAISLLDKWILFLKPTLESLTEAYKILKASAYLNRNLDYFILFEGYPDDPAGIALFEKLSAITLKHLGLQLYWLGYLNFSHSSKYILSEMALEHLFLNPDKKVISPEKWALGDMIHSAISSSEGIN